MAFLMVISCHSRGFTLSTTSTMVRSLSLMQRRMLKTMLARTKPYHQSQESARPPLSHGSQIPPPPSPPQDPTPTPDTQGGMSPPPSPWCLRSPSPCLTGKATQSTTVLTRKGRLQLLAGQLRSSLRSLELLRLKMPTRRDVTRLMIVDWLVKTRC